MATVLGLLGLALFIVAVVALAAGVTWLVVKLIPPPHDRSADAPPADAHVLGEAKSRRGRQRRRPRAAGAGRTAAPK